MLAKHSNVFLKYIGYMQAICIILVVAGHSLHMYPDGHHGAMTLGYRLIYSFHMPAFLFVSGFLFDYTSRKLVGGFAKIVQFVKERAQRLLIPFCFLTAVTFVPRALLSGIADDNIPLTWLAFVKSFLFEDSLVLTYFWFIQVLFLLSCVMAVLYYKVADKLALKIVVLALCCVCFLCVNFCCDDICAVKFFSFGMLVKTGIFFVLGCLCGAFREKFEYVVSHSYLIPVFAALWLISFYLFDGYEQRLWCGVFGILMTTSLAYFIEKHNIALFDHLVGANYVIFLLSWYANVVSQQVLSHIIVMPWYCYSILSVVLGIYIPVAIYNYLREHREHKAAKLCSLLLGQRI